MLDLTTLKKLHDKAYNSGQTTRRNAADDMVFYFVTQWDGSYFDDSQLDYQGQFDILKKAGRDIMTGLAKNPVQIDFKPKDETRDDSAELADGLYRKSDRSNSSHTAYKNAKQEAVVCGCGAWELYTELESIRAKDNKQAIKRRPIWEANNCVMWDPNARLPDRSDANYVSVLKVYSEDGYKELVNDLTGEEIDEINPSTFKHPEISYAFPWILGESKKIYVTEFYYREKIKEKVLTLIDPFGQVMEMWERDLEKVMDEMMDLGFEIVDEDKQYRYVVTKYIASGEDILSHDRIAGEHIPIVPMFGELAYVEGEVHYEGMVRLAKDPQRLRNFQLSYLADIVSKSPREKPIMTQEQVGGYEQMYEVTGAENNYPYVLQHLKSEGGEPLPLGPVGVLPSPSVPDSLVMSIDLSRQAVEDVANPGLPQNIADPDLSGKAVIALENKMEKQHMEYQENFKHSKRRDAEIFASMASEIMDTPRKVQIELHDGTTKEIETMQGVMDEQTGDIVYLNDIYKAEFDIYSEIGPSYSTQKEQTVTELREMLPTMDPASPEFKMIQYKILELMPGVENDDIRDYVRKQLIVMNVRKPETDEEKQFAMQIANQPPKPDPAMELAKAEQMKAAAQSEKNQVEVMKIQANAQNEGMKRMNDKFDSMTDRIEAMIKAQESGAKIQNTNADTEGKQLENASKIIDIQTPDFATKTDDELFQILAAG